MKLPEKPTIKYLTEHEHNRICSVMHHIYLATSQEDGAFKVSKRMIVFEEKLASRNKNKFLATNAERFKLMQWVYDVMQACTYNPDDPESDSIVNNFDGFFYI